MTDAERKRRQRQRAVERLAEEVDDLSSRQGAILALEEHIARIEYKLKNLPADADKRAALLTRVNLEMVIAMAAEQIREIRELIDFHIDG